MAILSAVLVLVIAGCGLTLEQAVLEEAMRLGEGWTQTPVDSSTVQVLQAVAMEGRTIAVVGLARVEKDGQRSECVFVYEAVRTRLRWKTGGGGGGCGPGARLGLPLWIGSGQNSSVNADAWSRVYGVVYADEIVRAEVGWEDGLVQDVEVVRGSVLAVREGTHRYGMSRCAASTHRATWSMSTSSRVSRQESRSHEHIDRGKSKENGGYGRAGAGR